MSNHDNPRRGEKKRSEHGPYWEGGSKPDRHAARARAKWKKLRRQSERRTGQTSAKIQPELMKPGKPTQKVKDG